MVRNASRYCFDAVNSNRCVDVIFGLNFLQEKEIIITCIEMSCCADFSALHSSVGSVPKGIVTHNFMDRMQIYDAKTV